MIAEQRELCADNGNVDLISDLIKQHGNEAKLLDSARKEEEESLSVRYARPGQLSTTLQKKYQNFAKKIQQTSLNSVSNTYTRDTLAKQQLMSPTYLIGMEDFTIASMTALSIEPEYSCLPLSFYEDCIDRAVDFAKDSIAGAYGPCDTPVFAGLHAIDYDTAYLAGKKAGQNQLTGIATGMVGALRDKNYVDFRVQENTIIELGKSIPRPYLRTIEIIAGMHQGFIDATGKRPKFHALGIGTPILLPLMALMGDGKTYLSSDSTAPIADAWLVPATALYVDDPAPLKLKAYRIAQNWLEHDLPWGCTCPYCSTFNKSHPPDLDSARSWWHNEGRPTLTKYSLYRDSPISQWLPLLSNHSDSTLHRDAAMARVGHNHWVIKRIESDIRRYQSDVNRLRDHVAHIMEAYQDSGASKKWKMAAHQAWLIADTFAASNQL